MNKNLLTKLKKNKKGFTLIELIVVIAILGILAAIAIPRFGGVRETANEGAVKSNLRNIEAAVEMYVAQYNVERNTVDTDAAKLFIDEMPDGSPSSAFTYTVVAGVPTVTVASGTTYNGVLKIVDGEFTK